VNYRGTSRSLYRKLLTIHSGGVPRIHQGGKEGASGRVHSVGGGGTRNKKTPCARKRNGVKEKNDAGRVYGALCGEGKRHANAPKKLPSPEETGDTGAVYRVTTGHSRKTRRNRPEGDQHHLNLTSKGETDSSLASKRGEGLERYWSKLQEKYQGESVGETVRSKVKNQSHRQRGTHPGRG